MNLSSIRLWIIAAAALPLLAIASPLIEVDDARYLEVPREMALSGQIVTPTLDAMPYVEKPPLWYWCCAAAFRVFGVHVAVARILFWLFALAGVMGIWWLGSWLFDAGIGAAAAAATASGGLWIYLSHAMTLDLPVSAALVWCTAFAFRALERPEDAAWAAPLMWLCAGLAFLCKGLIGFLLPGLWVTGLLIISPRWRKSWRSLASPTGIIGAALITLPWVVAITRQRPDFLRVFFLEQHFARFLTSKYNRGAPSWFYMAVLPACLLPWTIAAGEGILRAPNDWAHGEQKTGALACWVLGVTAFFSISHSKLATYILPVVPHAGLLAAVALRRGLPDWAKRVSFGLGIIFWICATVCAAAVFGFSRAGVWPPPFVSIQAARTLAGLAALLFAAEGAALFASTRRNPLLSLAAGGTIAGAILLPALAIATPLISAREVGQAIARQAAPGDAVWTYGTYLHGLPYYSGRFVDKLVLFTGEFHYAKRDAAYSARFGDDNDIVKLPRPHGATFVVLRSFERPHFEKIAAHGNARATRFEDYGPWTLAVIR